MKLYHHPLSGHSHRAHLFLSLLGVSYELVEVDMAAGAHKAPDFLKLNPFGQVPVLDDDGTVIADSSAILVYLSRKYGRTDWLPEEAVAAARIQKWLSVAAGEIAYGPCAARLITVFGADFRTQEVIARAHRILALVEAELAPAASCSATGRPSPISRFTVTSPMRRRATSIPRPIRVSAHGLRASRRCRVSSAFARRRSVLPHEQPPGRIAVPASR